MIILCISSANFLQIWSMVSTWYTDFKFLWTVRLFWNKSSKLPDCQSYIRRLSAFRWSFYVLSSESFWWRILDVTMIAFIAILFRGKSSVQTLKSFDVSSKYSLPVLPAGSKNKFPFPQTTRYIFFKLFDTISYPSLLYILALLVISRINRGMQFVHLQCSLSPVMLHLLSFTVALVALRPHFFYLFRTSSTVALRDSIAVLSYRMMHYNRKSLYFSLTVAKYLFDVFWREVFVEKR